MIFFRTGQLHWESPREDISQATYTPTSELSWEYLTPAPMHSPNLQQDRRTTSHLPFLPDLDPRGTPLSSQRLNNESPTELRPSSRRRTSMVTIRNSFSDVSACSSLTLVSSNDHEATQSSTFSTPHPPSSGRPASGSKH